MFNFLLSNKISPTSGLRIPYKIFTKVDFPAPKKYGRSNRWFESDIEDWLKKEKEELHKDDGIFTEIGKFFDDLLS